jgi:hypothetical protein
MNYPLTHTPLTCPCTECEKYRAVVAAVKLEEKV